MSDFKIMLFSLLNLRAGLGNRCLFAALISKGSWYWSLAWHDIFEPQFPHAVEEIEALIRSVAANSQGKTGIRDKQSRLGWEDVRRAQGKLNASQSRFCVRKTLGSGGNWRQHTHSMRANLSSRQFYLRTRAQCCQTFWFFERVRKFEFFYKESSTFKTLEIHSKLLNIK